MHIYYLTGFMGQEPGCHAARGLEASASHLPPPAGQVGGGWDVDGDEDSAVIWGLLCQGHKEVPLCHSRVQSSWHGLQAQVGLSTGMGFVQPVLSLT